MTAKQKAMQIASNLGIEIETEYDCDDMRRLDRIRAWVPDGWRWDDALHGRVCAMQDDLSEDFFIAEELWVMAIKELETPIEKCPPDCPCLE